MISETGYLQLPDYQYWLDALSRDDHKYVTDTLTAYYSCPHGNRERPTNHELVNGQFRFPKLSGVVHKKITNSLPRKLTHPLTLAAAHGAVHVVGVLLDFGVDILVCEESTGNNILHCLIDAASLDPDHELDLIKVYDELRQRLPTFHLSTLLRTENGDPRHHQAMRPLEYAACKGTLRLMFALWNTPHVYVTREEIVGVSVYQWYDVTEYVTLVGRESRYHLSPIAFIAELSEQQLTTPFARAMFAEGLIADWIGTKMNVMLILIFFTLRITFVTIFSVYDMDESRLRQIGGVSSDDDPTTSSYLTNGSFIYCGHAGLFNYPDFVRTAMLIYLIIHSIGVIVYDVTSIVMNYKTNPLRYKRFLESEYSGALARYVNLVFSLSVFTQLILLNLVTERGIGTVAIDIVRLETTMGALLTAQYFMRMIPGIGHTFIYAWKTSADMAAFGWFIIDVILAFSRIEMLSVNINSEQGCISEFSNFYISVYTIFLSFLNMQDYTQFSVRSKTVLYTQHIIFVFVVGIMLLNLLLAISNDTVNRVYRDREMMISLGKLFATREININISRMPLIGRLYARYFHAWRVRKYFVCENESEPREDQKKPRGYRVYLVKTKSNRKQLECTSSGLKAT